MSFSSPILLTSSRRYVMPTTITVEVPSEDGPPRLLQVGVERAAPPKPWLGGYRSKVRPTRCGAAADMPHGHHNPRPLRHAHQESGTEYHHATAQTERPRPSTAEIARAANRAHRAAQTVEQAKSVFRTILATHTVAAVRGFPYLLGRHSLLPAYHYQASVSQQSVREASTQMEASGLYIDTASDVLREPLPYFDSDALAALRLEATVDVQRHARGWFARRLFAVGRAARLAEAQRRAGWATPLCVPTTSAHSLARAPAPGFRPRASPRVPTAVS